MIKGDTGYNKKNLLNAARFLGGGDLTPLEIPEIEGEDGKPSVVLLKRPSAGRILSINATSEQAREDLLFKLIAECVVDEGGKRLFTETQEAELREIPATVFGRLTNALMDLANTASIVAGTAAGNAPSGTLEAAPAPAVPEIPPTVPTASTVGSASPTSSPSTSASGT